MLALLGRRVDALLSFPRAASATMAGSSARSRDHAGGLPRPPARAGSTPTRSCSTTPAARAPRSSTCSRGGHRRIAYVGDVPSSSPRASESPATTPPSRRRGSSSIGTAHPGRARRRARARARCSSFPGAAPTAIFTGNNRHTLGAVRALRGREHRSRWWASTISSSPSCSGTTVVKHDPLAWATAAAALAFARLDGSTPRRGGSSRTELIARGSGEVPRP